MIDAASAIAHVESQKADLARVLRNELQANGNTITIERSKDDHYKDKGWDVTGCFLDGGKALFDAFAEELPLEQWAIRVLTRLNNIADDPSGRLWFATFVPRRGA